MMAINDIYKANSEIDITFGLSYAFYAMTIDQTNAMELSLHYV